MRIAAKRLRYTAEIFALRRISAPRSQSRSGSRTARQVHDCDVWIDLLPRFLRTERGAAGTSSARIATGIRRSATTSGEGEAHGKLQRLWSGGRRGEMSRIVESVRPRIAGDPNRSIHGEAQAEDGGEAAPELDSFQRRCSPTSTERDWRGWSSTGASSTRPRTSGRPPRAPELPRIFHSNSTSSS